jgi:hypothetical protein
MSKAQHIDKTSAEDKSIGFDYQYYYFLNELLNLKSGQTIGLEVMDDVHSELSDNTQILVQLKFTIQTKADGSPKNLNTLDTDFWKTVSNWCKVVCDKAAGRENVKSQIEFIEKTTFLLASNKSENENNKALVAIKDFQSHAKSYDDLMHLIRQLLADAAGVMVSGYLQELLNLPGQVSKAFLLKIRFDLGCDDIIQNCKKSIIEHFIDPTRVDDVFHAIDSQLRSDNFELVTKKQKITINFKDFTRKYRIHFDKVRNESLVIRRRLDLPDSIGEQLFLRQLIDIGDVQADDTAQISDLSYHHLLAKNNLERWEQDGDITRADVTDFEEDALLHWKNLHRSTFRKMSAERNPDTLAQEIVDKLREKKLSIVEHILSLAFSNGEFYDLCEQGRIGWRNDWDKKYK